jgi:hypothetical protein
MQVPVVPGKHTSIPWLAFIMLLQSLPAAALVHWSRAEVSALELGPQGQPREC